MIRPTCSKCRYLSNEQVKFRPCPRIPILHREMVCTNEKNALKDHVTGESITPFCEEVNRHGECLVYMPTDLEKPIITFFDDDNYVFVCGKGPVVLCFDDSEINSKLPIASVYDEEDKLYKVRFDLTHTCTVKAACVIDGVISEIAELHCEISDIPEIKFDKTSNTVSIKSYNKVYFTTDGSKVTEDSNIYTGPFVIDHNTTVKARSYAREDFSEQVSLFCISIEPPVIEFDPDTNKVSLNADDPILYSLNGDDIYDDSTSYSEPFEITKNTLVKAACIVDGELSETVELECKVANPPVITYDDSSHKVTIESDNPIRYTIDGSDIKKSSMEYTAPFEITETCTVKAVSYVGNKTSSVSELECIFINAPEISFDPEESLVTITGDNTILFSTDGSKIYDDSDEYDEPFSIEKNTTVKAACILNGKLSKEVTLVCKVASVPKITFNSATKMVTITGENTILYTTDGSDVRKKDSEYKAPFKITETKTIKAKSIVGDKMSEQAELTCNV